MFFTVMAHDYICDVNVDNKLTPNYKLKTPEISNAIYHS